MDREKLSMLVAQNAVDHPGAQKVAWSDSADKDWRKWLRVLLASWVGLLLLRLLELGGTTLIGDFLHVLGNGGQAVWYSSTLLPLIMPYLSVALTAGLLYSLASLSKVSLATMWRALPICPQGKIWDHEKFRKTCPLLIVYTVVSLVVGLLYFTPYVVFLAIIIASLVAPLLLFRTIFTEVVSRLLPYKLMQRFGFHNLASYIFICGVCSGFPVLLTTPHIFLSHFLYAFSLGAIKAEVLHFTQGFEVVSALSAAFEISSFVSLCMWALAIPDMGYVFAGMPPFLSVFYMVLVAGVLLSQNFLMQHLSFHVSDAIKEQENGKMVHDGIGQSPLSYQAVNVMERPIVAYAIAGACALFSYYISLPLFLFAVVLTSRSYGAIPLSVAINQPESANSSNFPPIVAVVEQPVTVHSEKRSRGDRDPKKGASGAGVLKGGS